MKNLSRIKKISKFFYLLLSSLIAVIPLYYATYWTFINHLPDTLITVNTASVPLIANPISVKLRITGFLVSLLPLSALLYGLVSIRKLFSFYREGMIFSLEHVGIFYKTSKALFLWVLLSVLYESAKSIIFSIGNPPGQRVVSVGFSSPELTTLIVAGGILVIAWVMEEGRILTEEAELTV